MAALIYMDGTGAMYFGGSGEQRFSVKKSATPCPAASDSLAMGALRPRGYSSTCVLADITVKFDARVEPSGFIAANSTVGVHTLAMEAQTVAGTHQETSVAVCDTTCN